MGPGLRRIFAGNDAGGACTYSSAGATFITRTVDCATAMLLVRFKKPQLEWANTGKGIWQGALCIRLPRQWAHCCFPTLLLPSPNSQVLRPVWLFWHPNVRLRCLSAQLMVWFNRADRTAASRRFLLAISCILSHTLACLLNQGEACASHIIPCLPLELSYISLLVANITYHQSVYDLLNTSLHWHGWKVLPAACVLPGIISKRLSVGGICQSAEPTVAGRASVYHGINTTVLVISRCPDSGHEPFGIIMMAAQVNNGILPILLVFGYHRGR